MRPLIKVKVRGAGRVIHRCAQCGAPIDEPVVMRHIDGQLVALHKECPNGR